LKQSGGVCENHERSKKVTDSQDDGFVEEVENICLGVQKRGKIERVIRSQHDEFAGVLKENAPERDALSEALRLASP
jgi:hypothetical protein